jgi:hypothetical protein
VSAARSACRRRSPCASTPTSTRRRTVHRDRAQELEVRRALRGGRGPLREVEAHEGPVGDGLDCHIGSSSPTRGPFVQAMARVGDVYKVLRRRAFRSRTSTSVVAWASRTRPRHLRARRLREARSSSHCAASAPRWCWSPAACWWPTPGVLLTRVLYRKKTPRKHFVIVDAGMNDLLRPALYEAHHELAAGQASPRARSRPSTWWARCVSRPMCMGLARALAPLMQGDLLA